MLLWFAHNTLAAAVLALIVLVACRVGRFRPAIQHVLWLIVLVKLLAPAWMSWPWSPRGMATRWIPVNAAPQAFSAPFSAAIAQVRTHATAQPVSSNGLSGEVAETQADRPIAERRGSEATPQKDRSGASRNTAPTPLPQQARIGLQPQPSQDTDSVPQRISWVSSAAAFLWRQFLAMASRPRDALLGL